MCKGINDLFEGRFLWSSCTTLYDGEKTIEVLCLYLMFMTVYK